MESNLGTMKINQLIEDASEQDIIAALQRMKDPDSRHLLCYVAGEQQLAAAAPILITYLEDTESHVRSCAADALGKIGDPYAGEALLRRFTEQETQQSVRTMLATDLGAVGYKPAIPALIAALSYDGTEALRGTAAWALGKLQAQEALSTLTAALQREKDEYCYNRIVTAIDQIRNTDL